MNAPQSSQNKPMIRIKKEKGLSLGNNSNFQQSKNFSSTANFFNNDEVKKLIANLNGKGMKLKDPTVVHSPKEDEEDIGGIPVSKSEVDEFFKSISSFKSTKITRKDLKNFLSCLPKEFKSKDIGLLMNGLYEMDATQLHEILKDNRVNEYDAIAEAFKLLDPEKKGFIEIQTFRKIFEQMHLAEILPCDESIFMDIADVDKDGKITLEDFRVMLLQRPPDTDIIQNFDS